MPNNRIRLIRWRATTDALRSPKELKYSGMTLLNDDDNNYDDDIDDDDDSLKTISISNARCVLLQESCGALYCTKDGRCYSRGAPVAEGTICGHRKVK